VTAGSRQSSWLVSQGQAFAVMVALAGTQILSQRSLVWLAAHASLALLAGRYGQLLVAVISATLLRGMSISLLPASRTCS
jgi:hypothetical protein